MIINFTWCLSVAIVLFIFNIVTVNPYTGFGYKSVDNN